MEPEIDSGLSSLFARGVRSAAVPGLGVHRKRRREEVRERRTELIVLSRWVFATCEGGPAPPCRKERPEADPRPPIPRQFVKDAPKAGHN
jgi:hypothetical protein